MTDYVIYDVFTDKVFEGNQLAVIPDASGLNEGDLQRIAKHFNFTETVFMYPPKAPEATAHLRIFTQTKEVLFAGHPIIGATIALSDLGYPDDMVLETSRMPISTKIIKGDIKSASFTLEQAPEFHGTLSVADVAQYMSLLPNNIVTKNHPPQITSLGIPFVMVELTDLYALAKIHINIGKYIEFNKVYRPSFSDRLPTYAYVRTETGVQSRAFDPLSNIPEDAASGNAAAALGGLLSTLSGQPLEITLSQGVEMGKPSKIKISTTVQDRSVTSITIGGSAVKVMHGSFDF